MFVWLPIRDGALTSVPSFTQNWWRDQYREYLFTLKRLQVFFQHTYFWNCIFPVNPPGGPNRDPDTSLTVLYGLCGCHSCGDAVNGTKTTQSAVWARYMDSVCVCVCFFVCLGGRSAVRLSVCVFTRAALTDAFSIRPPGESAEEHTDSRPFPWWRMDVEAFKSWSWGPSVAGLPPVWCFPAGGFIYFVFPGFFFQPGSELLPFGFFNGWAGIISDMLSSFCTAQDVVFGELPWCSALFLNGCALGVFHNVAAWCMAPRGETALPPAGARQNESPPPPSYSEFSLNWWCVCEREFLFFLPRWKRPEWSHADLCGLADVVFIVNDEEMFCLKNKGLFNRTPISC